MISKLILGTVQFGLNYGINNTSGQTSIKEVFKVFDVAKEKGIYTLDTAEVYGTAHSVIGRYHENEHKFKIITKIPAAEKGIQIQERINHYLNELGVKELECLMFHSFSAYQDNQELLNKVIALKDEGLVKKIGVSVYTNKEIEFLLEDKRIDLVQLPFNVLDNWSLRGECIKQLKARGKEVHTRSAFLQGLFFKTLQKGDKLEVAFGNEIKSLKGLAVNSGFSMEQLALLYCIQQKDIDKVIIGVENEHQLTLNLNALKLELPNEVMRAIDAIHVKNLNLLNPSKW